MRYTMPSHTPASMRFYRPTTVAEIAELEGELTGYVDAFRGQDGPVYAITWRLSETRQAMMESKGLQDASIDELVDHGILPRAELLSESNGVSLNKSHIIAHSTIERVPETGNVFRLVAMANRWNNLKGMLSGFLLVDNEGEEAVSFRVSTFQATQ